MVVELERDVDQADVQAEKAKDGPGADQQESHAGHEADGPDRAHQDEEAARRQRSMRMQDGAERRLLFCGLIVHAESLRTISADVKTTATDHMASLPSAAKPKIKPKPASRRRSTRLSKPAIAEIFRRFAAHDPQPKGEFEHSNAFTLLVAVVLSAQATDAGVNKATRALFAAADTPEKMVALGEERVREFVKTIGLYRNKAKNVVELSRQLIARHGSVVPADRDVLEEIAGRGPEDGERRHERGFRCRDHGCRHARLPHRQPHRACRREKIRWRWRQTCCGSFRRSMACRPTIG